MELGGRYDIWQTSADWTSVQQHKRDINGKTFSFTAVHNRKTKATSVTVSLIETYTSVSRTLTLKREEPAGDVEPEVWVDTDENQARAEHEFLGWVRAASDEALKDQLSLSIAAVQAGENGPSASAEVSIITSELRLRAAGVQPDTGKP